MLDIKKLRANFDEVKEKLSKRGEDLTDFDKLKYMELPRRIYVGHNALDKLIGGCKNLDLHGSALIIADDITYEVAGKYVQDLLEENEYSVDKFIIKGVTDKVAHEAVEVIEKHGANYQKSN